MACLQTPWRNNSRKIDVCSPQTMMMFLGFTGVPAMKCQTSGIKNVKLANWMATKFLTYHKPTVTHAQNSVIAHATVNAQWHQLASNMTSLGGKLQSWKFQVSWIEISKNVFGEYQGQGSLTHTRKQNPTEFHWVPPRFPDFPDFAQIPWNPLKFLGNQWGIHAISQVAWKLPCPLTLLPSSSHFKPHCLFWFNFLENPNLLKQGVWAVFPMRQQHLEFSLCFFP